MTDNPPAPIIAADKDDPYIHPAWAVYPAPTAGNIDIYAGDFGSLTLTTSQLDQLAIEWIRHRLQQ